MRAGLTTVKIGHGIPRQSSVFIGGSGIANVKLGMKAISYCRVSTKGQQKSGLGLAAQRTAVENYAAQSKARIVAEHVETESGRKSSRPILAAAIAECRRTGATLLIAKLDRLARSVHFISGLMESGVPFIACDMPNASPLELHIHASFAEEEARRIRQRTRDALAKLKARGVKLGNPPSAQKASGMGHRTQSKLAATYAATVLPTAAKLRKRGFSLQQIADHLTARGLLTRRARAWTPTAVYRLLG